MKTIKLIILLLVANNIFAQEYPVLTTTSLAGDPRSDINYVRTGNYTIDTNNERNQYVGLWRYEGNGMIFDLKIEKRDQYRTGSGEYYWFMDKVILKYRIVKNGITLFDNLNAEIPEHTYHSTGTKSGDVDYLDGLILDVTRNVLCHYFIVKLDTAPEKIKFDIADGLCRKLNPLSFYTDDRPLLDIPIYAVEMVKIE